MQNHLTKLDTTEPSIIILDSQFLIQSKTILSKNILSEILGIIKPNYKTNSEILETITSITDNTTSETNMGFYAPYTNYYTTFSTTVISLLERLKLVQPGNIIRLEEIYTSPQDPLVYKYYTNLSHYQDFILESHSNIINELTYFQSIRTQPHLLDTINTISPILSLDTKNLTRDNQSNHPLDTYSYFDLMSWIQCNSEHSRHWIFRTPLHSNTIYTNLS